MNIEEQKKFARTHADLTYHTIETQCKFCGKPLKLQIADIYPGNEQELSGLRTCNSCSELRVERRNLDESIQHVCLGLRAIPSAKLAAAPEREHAKHSLNVLVPRWCALASRWHKAEVAFDESMVESMLKEPTKYGEVLGRIWGMAKKPRPTPQPSLPYKDTP